MIPAVLTRIAVVLLSGLALSACSSGRASTFEILFDQLKGTISADPIAPLPELTRAELNQVPFATIALSRESQEGRAYVAATVDNGGYVSYQDANRRSVVLKGGMISGTRGFPFDLAAVKHQIDDPIAVQTPPDRWPPVLSRNYQYWLSGAADFQISVRCVLETVVREDIEIVEIRFPVVRIQERCANSRRSFTNTYWADPDSGFIWKSVQWVGPRAEPLTLEIIRPYAAG
ncbi:MAG: YjbF family lipoprotein [Pseudomonadota bacterium]